MRRTRFIVLAGAAAVVVASASSAAPASASSPISLVRPVVPVVACDAEGLTVDLLGTTERDSGTAGVDEYVGDGLVYDVYTNAGDLVVDVQGVSSSTWITTPVAGDDYDYFAGTVPGDNPVGEWTFSDNENSPNGDPILVDCSSSDPAPVYRFWSPVLKSHFFTMDTDEAAYLQTAGPSQTWSFEGEKFEAFPTQVAGTVPLYRFWSERMGGHFYTTNLAEANSVVTRYDDATWRFEGVAFYVYPTSYSATPTLEVSRFWSPVYQHHFYTADVSEAAAVKVRYPSVWSYEGIDFKVPVPDAAN